MAPKQRQKKVRERRDGAKTRSIILLEAERLFAEKGYDGVSIREITTASDVDLGLVNYHFKSKENLFHEVLTMRVDGMNEKRHEQIDKIELVPYSKRSLADLYEAFIMPFNGQTKAESQRLTNYRRLLALVANSRRWQIQVFEGHYDPIVGLLTEKIFGILPSAKREDVYWGVSFFLGTVASAYADTRRVDRLSSGMCDSRDLDKVRSNLINYAVDGMLGICGLTDKALGESPALSH